MANLVYHSIHEIDTVDESSFKRLISEANPFLVRNMDYGDCMTKWNLDYLTEAIADKQIVIHESNKSELNFLEKNFSYKHYKFSEFARLLKETNKSVYLRSTCSQPRARKAANIVEDFPELSNDLKPPSYIPYGSDNRSYHSSVLRISSSNVLIWTHFDLYDNILCQISGSKRIILIPPEDTKYLYLEGDKSRVDCFEDEEDCLKRFPLVVKAKLYSCHLKPGHSLFIPSLWWHNVRATSSVNQGLPGYSIGFNIFWRDTNLAGQSLYSDNDVYGNKNLSPYDSALTNIDKASQHMKKLPTKYHTLYKYMLFQQFKKKFQIDDD